MRQAQRSKHITANRIVGLSLALAGTQVDVGNSIGVKLQTKFQMIHIKRTMGDLGSV